MSEKKFIAKPVQPGRDPYTLYGHRIERDGKNINVLDEKGDLLAAINSTHFDVIDAEAVRPRSTDKS